MNFMPRLVENTLPAFGRPPFHLNFSGDSSADVEINSFQIRDCQICWDDRSSSARARYLANPLYVLAITEYLGPKYTSIVPHTITGILLMPISAQRGRYLRVGWVSLSLYL